MLATANRAKPVQPNNKKPKTRRDLRAVRLARIKAHSVKRRIRTRS
jgi:hypothetical protein